MWYYNSVFYQIYPIGFCGAPKNNDGVTVNRIKKLTSWLDHIKNTGANAIYMSPVFESDSHGYDTRDFRKIDCRLGTNKNFAAMCEELHKKDMKIVLDGVFNHVGRGFWAFKDVQEKKWDSPYKDWFNINFDGNSNYNDGFWYEGWEGHYELVKLNLNNNAVVEHIFECIKGWTQEFDIDGLRLDVAYLLNQDFLRRLRNFCNQLKPDFFLVGEVIHGDYNRIVGDDLLHSCTNYECYKGLYSSFNSMNMFEIIHSLKMQFGPEQWCRYTGKHLMCFVDNHDVSRIASVLTNENHLPLIYGLLFAMPGIPCLYYGSEWGEKADKIKGTDDNLRPCFETFQENKLTHFIAALAKAHKENPELCCGDFKDVLLTNKQCIFERKCDGKRMLVAINADSEPFVAHFNANAGRAMNVLTGQWHDFGGGSELVPYSVEYWKIVD